MGDEDVVAVEPVDGAGQRRSSRPQSTSHAIWRRWCLRSGRRIAVLGHQSSERAREYMRPIIAGPGEDEQGAWAAAAGAPIWPWGAPARASSVAVTRHCKFSVASPGAVASVPPRSPPHTNGAPPSWRGGVLRSLSAIGERVRQHRGAEIRFADVSSGSSPTARLHPSTGSIAHEADLEDWYVATYLAAAIRRWTSAVSGHQRCATNASTRAIRPPRSVDRAGQSHRHAHDAGPSRPGDGLRVAQRVQQVHRVQRVQRLKHANARLTLGFL